MPVTSIANIQAKPSMRSVKSSRARAATRRAMRSTCAAATRRVAVERHEQRRERDGAGEPGFRVARIRREQQRRNAAGERQREQHDQCRLARSHRHHPVASGADTVAGGFRDGVNESVSLTLSDAFGGPERRTAPRLLLDTTSVDCTDASPLFECGKEYRFADAAEQGSFNPARPSPAWALAGQCYRDGASPVATLLNAMTRAKRQEPCRGRVRERR